MAEDTNGDTNQQATGFLGWVSQASGVSLSGGTVFLFAGLWMLNNNNEEEWSVPEPMIWFMFTAAVLLVAISVAIRFHDHLARDENYDDIVDGVLKSPKLNEKLLEKLLEQLEGLRKEDSYRPAIAGGGEVVTEDKPDERCCRVTVEVDCCGDTVKPCDEESATDQPVEGKD